jgi:hypothetical protein
MLQAATVMKLGQSEVVVSPKITELNLQGVVYAVGLVRHVEILKSNYLVITEVQLKKLLHVSADLI